jgi:Na+/melibiose symporter-like transporter
LNQPADRPAVPRVPNLQVLAFAMAGAPISVIGLMSSTYLPPFYAGHVGLGLATVGAMLTLVRFIDLGVDPVLGTLMDRTKTRIGRYRPWVAASIPFLMLATWMLLTPPQGAPREYLLGWVLVLSLGGSLTTLGQAAWAGGLAVDYHDRSRVYGWGAAVSVLAIMAFLMLPLITRGAITPGAATSMGPLALILVVAVPIGLLSPVFFTPERINESRHEGLFPWREYASAIARPEMIRIIGADLFLALGPGTLLPMYFFFFKDVKAFPLKEINFLLVPLVAAALIGSPLAARIARRFGKHRTLMGGCFAFAVAQTILMAIPRADFLLTSLGMLLVGLSSAGFTPLLRAMVADVADEVRLEQNKEQLGLLYAMVTTTSKIGAAVAVSIVYFILQSVGYKAEGVNTPAAINGLAMCYLFAPIILVVAGGACLWGYALDEKRHSEIRVALEARDAAAAAIPPA